MPDFSENDLRDIERDRDLPPDEPYAHLGPEFCPVCGQPDNCGDCDHTPASEVFGAPDDPVIP